ncbi:MAG: acyl-CoA/acyl-ACP dehydrogenase [Frankiales bacterium]|nr:acyl-CoA/acyl-ACP dehydrogenase [Frankiales bacterium]
MTSPVVQAATELSRELAADAARLEREGVNRAVLDRMAAVGLLAVAGPPDLGGAWPAEQRQVAELLAGASPDAWFVWFQHGPVVKMLKASDNEDLKNKHLPELCAGRELGGVAYSHLRTPKPSVFATRVEGGWSLSGFQPWCTGWGLTDVVLVGALVPETDQVVFGLVPAGNRPEMTSAGELRLAAMAGTSTHALRFDGLRVDDTEVVLLTDRGPWAQADSANNTNVQPSTYGIALAALELLAEREPDTAMQLRPRLLELRTRAYRLIDEVEVGQRTEQRLALRAESLLVGIECCTALLAARGGQGMDLGEPAQLLLRAAAFQLVHSQAAHIRAATLEALIS